MNRLIIVLICFLVTGLSGCFNMPSYEEHPDYPVLTGYLYGHWKMELGGHEIEDQSISPEQKLKVKYPLEAWMTLDLNSDGTYRVVRFNGKDKEIYDNPRAFWKVRSDQDDRSALILYCPPKYISGEYTEFAPDNRKEPDYTQLEIVGSKDQKGQIAFCNGFQDDYACFYREE